jgi:hypothetical protein
MLAWPRVLFGSVLNGMLDKVVASFLIGSIGFVGGAAAGRGPDVGASSWLRLLKILMRELMLTVHQFHVLRWLNVNVASTRGTDAGPTLIVSKNFQHLQ